MWILPLLASLFSFSAMASTHHNIITSINPVAHSISVIDKVSLENLNCNEDLIISLHSDLHPKIISPLGATITLKETEIIDEVHKLKIEHFKLRFPCNASDDTHSVTFEYGGVIFHPITDPDDPYSRGTADSPGLISTEGVVLSSGTYWYPKFENINDQLVTFSLQAEAPLGWTVVSQGEKLPSNSWVEKAPQEDIFIIAAQFTEYNKLLPSGMRISAFLRTKDDAIANQYLDATSGYIERYNSLIGPYPYAKFALIENFWDTGFGMPSFTLLGSNIIRLPFIINTSYPHEILHDWWGNSVYVDYARGNWCEGITAYMADHLMSELAGSGDNYRRDTLQKYTDFVTPKNDFPLNRFLTRHDAATEAVGYGKSLMLFHMLRMQVGDDNFKKSFADFYSQNIFHEVSFGEIRQSFENSTGLNLKNEFTQWVDRTGAPSLKVSDVTATTSSSGFLFHAKIEQTQVEEPFIINLPIAIHLEGLENATQEIFKMNGRTLDINLKFAQRPAWLQIDPEFDIFRRLAKDEVPPVLTMALGAQKTLIILPSQANDQIIANWKTFINTIRPALPKETDIQIVVDTDLNKFPSDCAFWVLGKQNLFTKKFNDLLKDQGVKINSEDITINDARIPFNEHSFTLMGRDNNNQVWTFIATDSAASFPTLANKLIHYGKYSYLGFEGDSVTNKIKGIWKLLTSSMSVPVIQTDGVSVNRHLGKLVKRRALVNQ